MISGRRPCVMLSLEFIVRVIVFLGFSRVYRPTTKVVKRSWARYPNPVTTEHAEHTLGIQSQHPWVQRVSPGLWGGWSSGSEPCFCYREMVSIRGSPVWLESFLSEMQSEDLGPTACFYSVISSLVCSVNSGEADSELPTWEVKRGVVIHSDCSPSPASPGNDAALSPFLSHTQGSSWLLLVSPRVMSNSFATPWTVAHQASLSMRFPRQEYWSKLPFPSPGKPPDPGIEPASLVSAGRFFTTEPPGNSWLHTQF